jgi:subfamily B ATP-binding cassette protein HlyB/CyaB
LAHTTNRIDVELGSRLFYHLLRLPLDYFETRSAGVTVARMRELETIRNFLTGQGIFSVVDLLFVFVFIGVLFLYSWFLALIVLCTIPLYVGIAAVVRPMFREKLRQKFNRWSATQQFLVESVVGVPTLKAAAVEPVMQHQWEERLAAYVKTSFDATLIASAGQNSIEFVTKLATALILFFGAKEVIEGRMSVGQLIAFNMIANQVASPILRISQLWQDFQQIQISVERLGDVLNARTERLPQGAAWMRPARGSVEFRGVTFRYRPELPDAVRSLSFAINAGEVVGIVGQSGSGKSTLTKLLQRLYLAQSGQILIDGTDIAQLDPFWLRRQLGVVLQENLLFSRTIHENIALARPEMSRDEVVRVARLAGAHKFIMKLPMGYDSPIEERGANLSGGQRQRIAIARALATNPRILIFDEATSALDYQSEQTIQKNMGDIVKGRTVVIIAHRLAAVRHCNRIIGMSEGRIVEIGSHQELLANPDGVYAQLWALQSGQPNELSHERAGIV